MSPAEHLQSIISEFSGNIDAAGAATSSVGDLVRASLQSVSNQTAHSTPTGVGEEALAEALAGSQTTTEDRSAPESPRPPFLDNLIEMGYSERLSRRAIRSNPSNNDRAVAYCVEHQEEDELQFAIEMSLQDVESPSERAQSTSGSTHTPTPTESSEQPDAVAQEKQKQEEEKKRKQEEERIAQEKKEEEEKAKKEAEAKKEKEKQLEKMHKLEQFIIEPIKKEEITKFTDEMIPGCLQLLDDDPETVYRISDLLIVTIRRNGLEWMTKMLKEIVQGITKVTSEVFKECHNYLPGQITPVTDQGDAGKAVSPPWIPTSVIDSLEAAGFHSNILNNSRKLSTGLLLLTLLFDEAKMDCVKGLVIFTF